MLVGCRGSLHTTAYTASKVPRILGELHARKRVLFNLQHSTPASTPPPIYLVASLDPCQVRPRYTTMGEPFLSDASRAHPRPG